MKTPENNRDMEAFYRKNPDFRDVARLREILEKEDKKPNVILRSEFEEFLPLFREAPEFDDEKEKVVWELRVINPLTKKYESRINLYKPTYVYNTQDDLVQNKAPILVIPPTFVTFASIKHDEKGQKAVDLFRKDGGSDIPRLADRAEAGILEALKAAHSDPDNLKRYQQIRRDTVAQFDEFMLKKYGRTNTGTTQTSTAALKSVAVDYEQIETDFL